MTPQIQKEIENQISAFDSKSEGSNSKKSYMNNASSKMTSNNQFPAPDAEAAYNEENEAKNLMGPEQLHIIDHYINTTLSQPSRKSSVQL